MPMTQNDTKRTRTTKLRSFLIALLILAVLPAVTSCGRNMGILVTGSGKTAAGLPLMALLSSELYDFSDAYIVSVGCSGGSVAQCTLGDVVVVTGVCDYDLGHHVDAHERKHSESHIMWFPDDAYADYEYKPLNAGLCETVYAMIKDCPMQTTEEAMNVMAENFCGPDRRRYPSVR